MSNPNAPAAPTAPVVAESNLTYQSPAIPADVEYAEQAEFNQSLKDIVSEIEGEFNPAPEFEDETPAEGTEATEDKPDAEAEAKPEGDAKPDEDPAIARGMERLVSREVALQAKEAAFQAREARVATLEQELTKLRAAVPSADIQEQFTHSPSDAIKALGHDPETVVRLMIAEQLKAKGQEVPAALQEFVKSAETKREINALKAQLASQARAAEQAAVFNAVTLGAREYVKNVDGKAMPTLANIAKANPERAHAEIMAEISNDARARMAADPNGEPLTYQEAAKRVEARLADLKALLGTTGPAQTDPTKQAIGKPNTPPQQKPPARPLKPWEKKGDDIYAQGLKEAEREFYKHEAAARARR